MSSSIAERAGRAWDRHRSFFRSPAGLMLILLGSTAFIGIVGHRVGWTSSRFFEILAIVTGILSVVQAVKLDILNFPTGIACNLFFMVVFLKAHLYGNMGLQTVFVVLGAHGWYKWARGVRGEPFRVTRVPRREAISLVLIGIPAFGVLVWYLGRIGGAVPLLDAFTTVLSLAAQYLLNLKRLANWTVGIGVDIIYTGMYVSQKLYPTAALFAFYLMMCILGHREWRSILRAQEAVGAIGCEPQIADLVTGPRTTDHRLQP